MSGNKKIGSCNVGVRDAHMKNFDGILGKNFLEKIECMLDFKNGRMIVGEWSILFEKRIPKERCTLCNIVESGGEEACYNIDENDEDCRVKKDKNLMKNPELDEMKEFCAYMQEKIRDPI